MQIGIAVHCAEKGCRLMGTRRTVVSMMSSEAILQCNIDGVKPSGHITYDDAKGRASSMSGGTNLSLWKVSRAMVSINRTEN